MLKAITKNLSLLSMKINLFEYYNTLIYSTINILLASKELLNIQYLQYEYLLIINFPKRYLDKLPYILENEVYALFSIIPIKVNSIHITS
jgi:hypothetical protein